MLSRLYGVQSFWLFGSGPECLMKASTPIGRLPGGAVGLSACSKTLMGFLC